MRTRSFSFTLTNHILADAFEGGDNHAEAVLVGAPGVGFVLERQVVSAGVQGADRLLGVPTREVRLWAEVAVTQGGG